MEPSIDVKVPREAVYRSFKGQPGPCPKCGGTLRQDYQHYMIATRDETTEADTFLSGGKFGWFCDSCPIVVINVIELREQFNHLPPHWNAGSECEVVGMVNIDAIPERKRHLPIGAPGNPAPLVPFANVIQTKKPSEKIAYSSGHSSPAGWGSKILRKYDSRRRRSC